MTETRTETTELTTIGGVKKRIEKVYKRTERDTDFHLDYIITLYELGDASAVVHDFCLGGNRYGRDSAVMTPFGKDMPSQRTRTYKHASSAHEKAVEWCIEHK